MWAGHHSPDRGPSGSLRAGQALGGNRIFSVDLGVNAALADEGFVSGVLGLEARAWPQGTVSPFVRLEGGLIFEESAGYSLLGVGGGVAVRLKPNLSLRASAMSSGDAFAEGAGGPKVFQVGLEYRWERWSPGPASSGFLPAARLRSLLSNGRRAPTPRAGRRSAPAAR